MRFGVVVFAFLMACCSSKDTVLAPVVSDYFPIRVGAYFIYAVDSLITDQSVQTNYMYDLKVQAIDSFANGDHGFTYVLQRSKRPDSLSAWTSMISWSARINTLQAIVNEGNISYIKLEGPLSNGTAWDGNSLNNLGGTDKCLNNDLNSCDVYTVEHYGTPYSIPNGLSFRNSLTVVQSDNEDFIVFQDKRSEVYAEHIGLVYRQILQLQYCMDTTCVGQQRVSKGISYSQTLKEYGGL
jgi:hypothetical protein